MVNGQYDRKLQTVNYRQNANQDRICLERKKR
jgi:hypothetical protein